MEHSELSSHDWDIIFAKTLMWVGLAFLGFACTVAGTFYAWIFAAYFIAACFFVIRYALQKKLLGLISKELWIAGAVAIIAAVLFSFHTAPTIFSGRDQGTMSEAAIRLAQNHQLAFSTPASDAFFAIYGPGKALNFPGFYYTQAGQLTPQFPLVYIGWLAIFYSFFGLTGLIIANAVLLAFFLFSFYALARNYLNKTYSSLALAFVLTSFSFMWFSKFTLSENMALALLWIMILSLARFTSKQEALSFLAFIASATVLIFTRIEGIAFFAVASVVLCSHRHAREYIAKRYKHMLVLPVAIIAGLFFASLNKEIPYYKEVIKGLLGTLDVQTTNADFSSAPNALPAFFTARLLYLYGLLGFILLGFAGAAVSFIAKRFSLLSAFFVIAPSLLYLVDSHISPDQPWMLRRYAFSILPAGILYTAVFLAWLHETLAARGSKLKFALPLFAAALLVSLNLPSFLKYIGISENAALLDQTHQLSNTFSSRDLVLVDRLADGDGWAMLTGPMNFLYGKNAVYFFNTNDLAKIDTAKFDHVYLITPDIHRALYTAGPFADRLQPVRPYSISTTALDISAQENALAVSLPEQQTIVTTGTIYNIKK